VVDAELWPAVNAAFRAGLEFEYRLIEQDPDLDAVTSGHVRRQFNLLVSDYSAGRDLDEIRADFERLLTVWTPPSEIDAGVSGLEVGVWLRAFGLESHLAPWLAAHRPSSIDMIDRWVLGDAEAVFHPTHPKGPKLVADTHELAQPALVDPDGVRDDLADYLKRRWYRGSAWRGWWNLRNSENLLETGIYEGYWCWEAAAIVMLAGVDDSHLRERKYYPYDLVHYLDD
jgi:hypothetical protein